jgi:hypothetical protein
MLQYVFILNLNFRKCELKSEVSFLYKKYTQHRIRFKNGII